METNFGHIVREKRLAMRLTLREFCDANGYDPGNHSKLERGVLPPPRDAEKLVGLAKALGIKRGSQEWTEFHDWAFVENGQVPDEMMKQKELLRRLPVLFRTIGSKPLSPEKLDQLIEMVRKT